MADQEILHKASVEVVVVPFPAQSHLNQLLQISHIISSYNIKVHYVGSALHVAQAKSRAPNFSVNPRNPKIEFHSFETPEFPSPAPENPDFPSQLLPSFEATTHLRSPVSSLISSLSAKTERLVVIHEKFMSSVVQDAEALDNVERYIYHSLSTTYRLLNIPGFDLGAKIGVENFPSMDGIWDPAFRDLIQRSSSAYKTTKKAGVLLNTCKVLEDRALDLFMEKERENNVELKIWAIGPLETMKAFKKSPVTPNPDNKHKCIEWLDEQETRSVLYVSFGTTTFMVDDQIEELAKGLEEGGSKFIWVLRDADRGNVFEGSEARRPKLPLGFEERIAGTGMGMVVREWAPQMEILGHPSTGGFVSHCGWSSCMESLALGVPLIAWPIHSDQPVNAFLVSRILKAGLVVREWEKRHELVSSSAIGAAVKRLMGSNEGEKVRKRAEELGCELRKCTEEDGVTRLEWDSFIAHITRA